MTDETVDLVEDKPKRRLGFVFSVIFVALIGLGGGFGAVVFGVIPQSLSFFGKSDDSLKEGDVSFAFIEMPVINLSLNNSDTYRHLRTSLHLEVPEKSGTKVKHLVPRLMDVLNGYLRAVDISDLESAGAMSKLRAQMLRRVQVVAGPGAVNDLLITEFILN
jgi:flagellar FliL protein